MNGKMDESVSESMSLKVYEDINFTYFNPINAIFKEGRNQKASYRVYSCCNKDNCQAYSSDKCVLLNHALFYWDPCPYGKVREVEGFTRKARKFSSFLSEAKDKYKEISYKLSGLNYPAIIGDKVYIPLPFLDNYVNPIKEIKDKFVDKDMFTADFVIMLADFRPQALMGGVIKQYQDKDVPEFLLKLKRHFPELYQEVAEKRPDLAAVVGSISYVGKKAKVKTLLPGKVKLGTRTVSWDGNVIVSKGSELLLLFSLKNERVEICPEDSTYVEVVDDATVTEVTEFKE